MALAAFAGRYAPHDAGGDRWQRTLPAALREDGPARSARSDGLTIAWTAPISAQTGDDFVCLVDGLPRVTALAAELGLDPALPAAQVIEIGFARRGEKVLEGIAGEYSLLIWDSRSRRGLLARDPLGARPLFVAEAGGALLFASEIRNLLALLPAQPAPDALAVSDWLSATSSREDRTLYEGIRRVAAGHALRLHQAGWERFVHWRPRYVPGPPLDAAQAAAVIRTGLQTSVGEALADARHPAVMLSGGFDSAAVSATARSVCDGRELRVYSGVFPTAPAVDESGRIARVRDWLGLSGVEMAFQDGSALSSALEFLSEWRVPSASPNLFIWSPLLRRAAADGIDVMLDGEGGDELFGCAVYLLADRLLRGRALGALALARRLPGMGARPRARWLLRALAKFGVRGALPYGPHQRLRRVRERPPPAWLSAEATRLHRTRDDPWFWKRGAPVRWWGQLADVLTGQSDALGAADQLRREAALTGVTMRHPLRDPKLIELVLGLPPELAFHPRLDRPLARRAMRGQLPEDILANEEKPAFNSLLTAALSGRDLAALRSLLDDPHPELARHVRQAAVSSLLDRTPDGALPLSWATELWRLASLELWLDHQFGPEHLERTRAALDAVPRLSFVTRTPAPGNASLTA